MNRDQVNGRAREIAGKVKKNAGRAMGNRTMQAKGLAKEAGGKVQKNVGDLRSGSRGSRNDRDY